MPRTPPAPRRPARDRGGNAAATPRSGRCSTASPASTTDEPRHLGVPGAALAAARPADRRVAGDARLDVATGTGKVAADLKERAQPDGRVLGIDISPEMITSRSSVGDRPG